MESLTSSRILNFNSDTLQYVRKQHNLDHPERMKEAIDIIEEWIRKQNHFAVKCFPRDYLERLIIQNKGYIEKTKSKIDRLCTLKTAVPQYFGTITKQERLLQPNVVDAILPQLTPENERIYVLRNTAKSYNSGFFYCLKYIICLTEYVTKYDYNNGVTIICDYMQANIFELVKTINIIELQQIMTIGTEGYSMRIKHIHILSKNKAVDLIVGVFKKVLSAKLIGRITIHQSLETLYDYVPKRLLPKDYGGEEMSLDKIYENNLNEITSAAFTEHLTKMTEAVTREEYRGRDVYATDAMGVAGTFRTIYID